MPRITTILNNYSILKQIPVFEKLGWLKLQKIARRVTMVEYKKGEIIRKQGDPADAFYCLIAGRIQAYVLSDDGKKRDAEFIRRGMHFGIISLLTGENHSTCYEAINDSLVLKINKIDFAAILKSIPELGIELSQSLSRRIHSHTTHTKAVFESKVVSIYSPVKGTGSSTYATNLAISLQQETKRKVILASISSIMEKHESGSSGPEASPQWKRKAINIKEIIEDHDRILQSVSKGELDIDLLNVSFDPRDLSLIHEISRFVSALVTNYDFVIVDLPNHMDEVVLKTLTQSDIVQLVTLARPEDLKMTKEVVYNLEETIRENFQQDKIQVIISGRQEISHGSFEEIQDTIDYPVFTKLPHIGPGELTHPVICRDMAVMLPAPNSDYAKSVKRIARQIGGVMVGLVLGGGAALGVAHVGIIQVLEEEKIPVDVVIGSSMGALLASFWAVGKNGRELETLAREFESKKGMLKLWQPVLPISGLMGGKNIEGWMKKTLGDKTFYSTEIPLKVVAYDLIRRQEIVIDSGSILQAVRKSIAIPGVIEPVLEKDKVIIDGGVLNPLPTNVLVQMGIKRIIAINVLQSPEQVAKGYELELKIQAEKEKIRFSEAPLQFIGYRCGKVFGKIFLPNIADIIVRTLQASEYIIALQSAQYANVMIHPDLEGINWFELYKVDRLIQSGREAAQKALPQIRELLKEQK